MREQKADFPVDHLLISVSKTNNSLWQSFDQHYFTQCRVVSLLCMGRHRRNNQLERFSSKTSLSLARGKREWQTALPWSPRNANDIASHSKLTRYPETQRIIGGFNASQTRWPVMTGQSNAFLGKAFVEQLGSTRPVDPLESWLCQVVSSFSVCHFCL